MSDQYHTPTPVPAVQEGPLSPVDYEAIPLTTPDGPPVADPGLEEHVERLTDVDEAAGNRAYRQVLGMLALVPLLAIAFVVIYFAVPKTTTITFGPLHTYAQNLFLGLTGGLAVLLIGLALVQWSRQLMNDAEFVDLRHPASSPEAVQKEMVKQLDDMVDDTRLGRRPLIGGALLGAIGIAVVPAVVVLADMGPHPGPGLRAATIEKTVWAEGVRLVNDITEKEIRPEDIEIGQLINGQPASLFELHGTPFIQAKAKSSIVVVRMEPDRIKIPESRKDWQVGGILCYSKICTHVGCPISLWERTTHHLLCPCHQSTFDLGDSGVVVFGPATRSLPQLPIKVDAEGFLVAQRDFDVPVGPSYFERDSRNDYKKGDN
ncbi:Rieske 2Fe-2S domain-containing protein [Propionibacteriaceae bacterium G1746]|uniref:cytochrome bc1 complex Rieske iron-sulfur subunit n=1 Tax=Aestuariimicrobium sp. G57 TaxID=3418485 RepID=UPI003C18C545